jgi:16S rRNA (uracil1498-N3)-methyltransferase
VSAPRVYMPDVSAADFETSRPSGGTIALPDDESHHIGRVMRLKSGDPIVIFNGRGASWDAEIAGSGKHVTAKIMHARPPAPLPTARLTLAIGLVKGDAMDNVVRDATALDVAEVIPMVTAHSVVPKRARGSEAIARWQRVAVASAKQCGQMTLPVIAGVTDLAGVLHRENATKLMCVEPALGGADVSAIASDSILILIGPEGGWAEEEIQAARAAGAHTITLGRLTLRAELAPVVAITKVWSALTA